MMTVRHGYQPRGSGIASGVDHQTIGGGPFGGSANQTREPAGLYPNAVYYCSQEGVPNAAACILFTQR